VPALTGGARSQRGTDADSARQNSGTGGKLPVVAAGDLASGAWRDATLDSVEWLVRPLHVQFK
jgi:hypothetical protein